MSVTCNSQDAAPPPVAEVLLEDGDRLFAPRPLARLAQVRPAPRLRDAVAVEHQLEALPSGKQVSNRLQGILTSKLGFT